MQACWIIQFVEQASDCHINMTDSVWLITTNINAEGLYQCLMVLFEYLEFDRYSQMAMCSVICEIVIHLQNLACTVRANSRRIYDGKHV